MTAIVLVALLWRIGTCDVTNDAWFFLQHLYKLIKLPYFWDLYKHFDIWFVIGRRYMKAASFR